MADDLSLTRDGHVAVLEIHRPPANYFDGSLIAQIADAAEEVDADKDVRAIVLRSEGKHFCAGANFGGDEMGGDRVANSERVYRGAVRLFRIKVPVIAAVQGSAVGGGLGLACAADFRVASPSTRFHANFSLLGFHAGFGLSVTLPAIVGQQHAMDMLFASRRVSGERALEIGLADRLVPDGEQSDEAMRWAHEIADVAPLAVRSMKQTLRGNLADLVSTALDRELQEQAWLWSTKDSAAGIAANIKREKAIFNAE